VIFVRFADDYVAGFEHRDDAERFLADLRERLARFALELNAEKTRLIEFGRFAAERRAGRGLRKPETFDFLGFTHICAKDRHGRFKLKRITSNSGCRPSSARSRPSSCAAGISRSPTTTRRSAASTFGSCGTGTGRYGAAASAPAA
jgi:hypothetical protein